MMRAAKIVFHLYLNLLPIESDPTTEIIQERASKIDFKNRFECIEHLRIQYLKEWDLHGIIEKNGRYGFYLELEWKDGP